MFLKELCDVEGERRVHEVQTVRETQLILCIDYIRRCYKGCFKIVPEPTPKCRKYHYAVAWLKLQGAKKRTRNPEEGNNFSETEFYYEIFQEYSQSVSVLKRYFMTL